MAASAGVLNGVPSKGLKGIRLILARKGLRIFARRFASSGLSLTPAIKTYSKVILRRERRGNLPHAERSSSIG